MFSKVNWTNLVERAGWTAAQTFIITVAASGANYVSVGVWQSAALAAGAAFISALKSGVQDVKA